MRNLLNIHSASRCSTAAGSSTVNDSTSPLQGRPIPVPSILIGQDTSPSVPTSDYPLDLHGAQVQQKVPSPLLGEKEKTKAFNPPKPHVEQTYRYLLDAARNLNPSRWRQSFSLIVHHIPGEYGELSSLNGQPSSPSKQILTANQTDALVAAVAASGNEALLPPECNHDIDRLVKGYLQWRKEQSATTANPLSVSCCMHLLKGLQQEECSANSIEGDPGIHEYLAKIVSDKNAALSEAAKLEQQSPPLALFMYKLMEHTAPGLIASLRIDSKVLHKQPGVCALLAATLQGRFKVAEALTKNGSDAAQLQQQFLGIDACHLQELLPGLLPLLLHDQAWTTEHLPLLKEMRWDQLQHLFPLLLHDQAWTTEHLPLLKEMTKAYQLQYLFPLLQHDPAWTTEHFPLLNEMRWDQLQHLFPLLRHDHAWTTKHLPLLKEMDEYQLQHLLPLLQHDQAWIAEHLPLLKKMDEDQLRHLLPLLRHDQAWIAEHLPLLKEMRGDQLQHLLPLLLHDQVWTTEHLPLLEEMSGNQLQHLLPLLQHDQVWTTEHLPLLKEMNKYQLHYLLPLLQHEQAWIAKHFDLLKEMDEDQLRHLLPLLQYDQAWTTEHVDLLKEMDENKLQYLLPLLQYDQAWTTEHLNLLKEMDEDRLLYLSPLLQYDQEWTIKHLPNLQDTPKYELYQRARSLFLKEMNISSEGFSSASNPYVREALFMHDQDMEELTRVLKTHGASRSTLHPEQTIPSYLTEKFKHNYQQIPDATFGVENEMFIPGLPESDPSEIEHELNDRLGIKDKKYRYVEDCSLATNAPFATPSIEQTTSILHAPEDIQRLQSALSILNDWGAFTNHTAGVHIHTGIKQWKAANCLNTTEEKSKNRFLHQWDQELPEQFQERAITPYQLLFMKQFLVNMVSMQKDFYLVSRKSLYSKPNGPRSGNDLDKYYQDVSNARDYEELLLSSAIGNERCFNVNLTAYIKHGTLEVRGFTKKNSDSMEVDPNLPIRDLIFMQEVLIKVLHDTKNILLSGASPDDPIEVRPSAGLTEIAKEYVQDVFLLEALHALGQRSPEQRIKTMEAIVKDKDLMTSETLQKIRESQAALLEGDPLAQHFLNALSRDTEWNPSSSVERTPLKRIHSLRSMSDAGLSYSEQKP